MDDFFDNVTNELTNTIVGIPMMLLSVFMAVIGWLIEYFANRD